MGGAPFMIQDLDRGREAFHRGAWREAATLLAGADASGSLRAVEDLERLAVANYLVGRDEASVEAWSRVHQTSLDAGEIPRALRAAFWLTLQILIRGEWARVSGWLARCRRLLDAGRDDCAECGLLLVLDARTALQQGNLDVADEASARAVELAERFADPELRAFGLLVRGQVLARMGRVPEAIAHLDEAMVAATIEGVSPIAVGTVYCALIDACQQIMDLRRMREWTEVLTGWCRKQPDLVPFRGVCLVHRAEVLCMSGAWASALEEARLACGAPATPREGMEEATLSVTPTRGPMGAAFHQLAEIQRLRGRLAEAEAAYRQANRHGRSPGAGLALLHLARGDAGGAVTAIRRALAEPMDQRRRSATLAAAVEIETAAGHLPAARRASEELTALAGQARSRWLTALATQAAGTLLLVEGHARHAIDRLRDAWMTWQEIEAPYDAARVRIAMGLAHRALGDEEAAMLEFDAAERVCERLGAAPELRRIEELRGPAKAEAGALTPREREVLRRLATGMTNRAIARELVISERTVDRHVSNILAKLDLSSRAAATAYAYEHHLI